MKHLCTLFIFATICLTATAQTDWRQLPPNTSVQSEMPDAYDIAVGQGGKYYMIYAVVNQSDDDYDIYFDSYTTADGWNTIEVYETDNDSEIEIKVVQLDSQIFVMANSNNGDHMTIFEISGDDVSALDTHNFPGFSNNDAWGLYPGVYTGEVYFMYDYTKLHRFNYFSQTWTNAGNPFSGTGITPVAVSVYSNDDSVFVAGQYVSGGIYKIRLRAASKWNWSWGNYSSGSVYAMNGATADTITGNDSFYLFGDQANTMRFITRDNSIAKTFSVGGGTYGQGAAFPLNYDDEALVGSTSTGAWIMADAPNLPEHNVVYTAAFGAPSWTQLGASAFAASSVTASDKRLRVDPVSDRAMIGFVDNTASEYIVKITNDAPTLNFPGSADTNLCANGTSDLLLGLQTEDLDDDDVTLMSVQSSNTALIDPATLDVSVFNSMTNIAVFNVSGPIGPTATPETVTLTFSFTDGFDVLQHVVTYTVQPNVQALFTIDELELCSNGDAIDLYDYIQTPGGSFSLDGAPFEGHYYDPQLATDDEVVYTFADGSCTSSDTLDIEFLEAPVAAITTSPSTNCTQNDGTATLTITGGTTPYQFMWNNGNNADLLVTGLSPGAVHVDILDAAGCSAVGDAIVDNAGASVTGTTTAVTCYGAADGAIDITVAGMAPPLTVLWSNGYSVEDVSNIQPGTHQVWVTDATGCTVSANFDVETPDRLLLTLNGTNSACGSSDGVVAVNTLTGGTEPYTYSWSNGGTNDNISGLASGIYTLTVTDANGCSAVKSYGVSDEGAPYADNVVLVPAHCNGSDGQISADLHEEGTNPVFTWSTGATDTASIDGLDPETYSLHAVNDEGCQSYGVYELGLIAPERQQICIVTVDSATTTNLIVWEKNGDPTIDHYNIYRETMTAGQFQWIDSVHDDNLSVFNDVIASPSDRSWKYRIAAVDVCGSESQVSTAHKTIHLVTTDLGTGDFQVNWNFYQGTNAPGYNFYRYTAADGWQLITTTPSGLNYFTDSPSTTAELDYMVEFELSATCTADLLKSQDFNTTRSNKDKGQFSPGDGTGDSSNGLIETTIGSGTVMLFPNPVMDENVFVKVKGIQRVQYKILSLTGQEAGNGNLQEGVSAVNVAALPAGVYILRLSSEKETAMLRFVVR